MVFNIVYVLVDCDHNGFNIIKHALSLISVLHSEICCISCCLIVCIIGVLSACKKSLDIIDKTLSLVFILCSLFDSLNHTLDISSHILLYLKCFSLVLLSNRRFELLCRRLKLVKGGLCLLERGLLFSGFFEAFSNI